MKKTIILSFLLMFLFGTAQAQIIVLDEIVDQPATPPSGKVFLYPVDGVYYLVNDEGTLVDLTGAAVTAASTIRITEASAAVDDTRYFDELITMTADPAGSAEVTGFRSRVNKTGGSNGVYTLNGLEGVVGSSYADEAMSARGVYGRVYIDPNTVAGATMRTGIGGEFSYRASYSGGTEAVIESGTAAVGLRIWMAPYVTSGSVDNYNNFWGLWIYGEHASQRNADAAIKISDAGGGFTDDIILQGGNSITNSSANVIVVDAGLTIGDATTDVSTLNGTITSDQGYSTAQTVFYFRTGLTATSGTHNNIRGRAMNQAASGSTSDVRGVFGQATTSASLYGGTGTGVFANFIAKNLSTTVTGRGLFVEAESEATPTALTNLFGAYIRTKTLISPADDYYVLMLDHAQLGAGFQADAYLGMKSTSWSGGKSAGYAIDLNGIDDLASADIRGHQGETWSNRTDGAWTTNGTFVSVATYSKDVGGTTRDLLVDDAGLIGYQASSLKFKENIEDLNGNYIDRLYDLRPVSFDWKKSGLPGYGMIAEEAAETLPEVVSFDKDGNPETVNYHQLVPFLLKALQDQQSRIAELERRL